MQFSFEVLPLHPRPQLLETLTSYLTRLAQLNGITTLKQLCTVCFPQDSLYRLERLTDYPTVDFTEFAKVAACTKEKLYATTFAHVASKFGIGAYSAEAFLEKSIASSLRYCPYCLDEAPYYLLTWRFCDLNGCVRHQCYLLERCASCRHGIPLFAAPFNIGICPYCRCDLRAASSTKLSPAALQIAEQQLHDIIFLLTPHASEAQCKSYLRIFAQRILARCEIAALTSEDMEQWFGRHGHVYYWFECTISGTEAWEYRILPLHIFRRCAAHVGTSITELFEPTYVINPNIQPTFDWGCNADYANSLVGTQMQQWGQRQQLALLGSEDSSFQATLAQLDSYIQKICISKDPVVRAVGQAVEQIKVQKGFPLAPTLGERLGLSSYDPHEGRGLTISSLVDIAVPQLVRSPDVDKFFRYLYQVDMEVQHRTYVQTYINLIQSAVQYVYMQSHPICFNTIAMQIQTLCSQEEFASHPLLRSMILDAASTLLASGTIETG